MVEHDGGGGGRSWMKMGADEQGCAADLRAGE